MVSSSPPRTPRHRRFDQVSSPQMSSPRRTPRRCVRRVRDDAAAVLPLTERAESPHEDVVSAVLPLTERAQSPHEDVIFADIDNQDDTDSDVSVHSTCITSVRGFVVFANRQVLDLNDSSCKIFFCPHDDH